MPESSETPGRLARRVVASESDASIPDAEWLKKSAEAAPFLARDVVALEAVARRLLDGWEPTAYFWLDARYDRPDSPLTPEEARILDLLREPSDA